MRLLHTADLHVGRRLNSISLLDDQAYILEQIIAKADELSPDMIAVAGDIYDKRQPTVEAVRLLDRFFTELAKRGKPVFVVPGNHDQAERVSFVRRILENNGVHIAGAFDGTFEPVCMNDEYGEVFVHMLPFVKPEDINAVYGEDFVTYDEAVKFAVSKMKQAHRRFADTRNVLIAHQFVTAEGEACEVSDSEMRSIGGLDNVHYTAFDGFDYVALGHLHQAQRIGRDSCRYAGSPLKYSVSERFHDKCVILAEVGEKVTSVEKIPLSPKRDVCLIKAPIDVIVNSEPSDDYIFAVLTGGERHLEPMKKIRAVYKNCVSVSYEEDVELGGALEAALGGKSFVNLPKTPEEVFGEFYKERNGSELSDTSKKLVAGLLNEILHDVPRGTSHEILYDLEASE